MHVIDGAGIAWRIAATAFFVAANGFFVASEFALVKIRSERIRSLAKKGSARAKIVQHMLGRLDLYLSACQLGITISSLILGWLAEPAVATLLISAVEALGWGIDPDLLHMIALGIALTIVTVLHMTFGEQAPKIWAIHRAESTALAISLPLRAFAVVLGPLIWVINVMSNLILRAAGMKAGAVEEHAPDVMEIRGFLARSAEAGHITKRQQDFADNILEIVSREVRHILVPRSEVQSLSLDASFEENMRTVTSSGHSRFPLCRGGLDSVVGIVHAKAILAALADRPEADLQALALPATFVPDTQPLSRMIHELQQARSGCAVVVDEHGTTVGLAFLDDALEEIIGPIHDEFDEPIPRVHEEPSGALVLDGGLSLPEAAELLDIEEGDEDTIGGLVTSHMKKLPRIGDRTTIGGYTITVLGVSHHRITRLRFEASGPTSEEPA